MKAERKRKKAYLHRMAVVYISPVTYRCFLGFLFIALLSASGKIPIVTFFRKSCICII